VEKNTAIRLDGEKNEKYIRRDCGKKEGKVNKAAARKIRIRKARISPLTPCSQFIIQARYDEVTIS
jgi:hypothetical protein